MQPFKKAENPKQVRRVAKPLHLEAGDPRYVALDDIRGDDIREKLRRSLYIDPDDPNRKSVHISYAGHRGNGKTTELFAFMEEMKDESFFVYKQAYSDLAVYDLDYPDLMLYLVTMTLEDVCRRVEVDDDMFRSVENWFASETWTEQESYESGIEVRSVAEAGFSVPGLLKLLINLTGRITGGHKSVKEIRHRLKRKPTELIHRMNEFFDRIRGLLEKSGMISELVLIVDNLDRHPPEVMENAFSKWSDLFEQLNVHIIITVPLGLIYNPQGEPLSEFNFPPLVMPMPKIRKKEQAWDTCWQDGVDRLVDVIKARVEEDKVFAGEPDERYACMKELVLASGGSLRELMHLLLKAAEEAWEHPIAMDDVKKGIHEVRNEFMNPLRFDDLPVLHEINRSKRADHSPESARQLFYRFALEYNGEKWADVHPLIYSSDIFNDQEILRRFNES
ncbi:hypothetical protein QUF72_00250 [Desulfobacterales bacterium HSG2]|nr:hypothetical protein [Desulfobacterales bacterium HSG2]